jgi:hypothetical protein
MPTSNLVKKRRRPKVVEFHETLTPVVPLAPAAPSISEMRAGIPDKIMRAGLYIVWGLAAILAGVAVGLMMVGNLRVPAGTAPSPFTTAGVVVSAPTVPTLSGTTAAPQSQTLGSSASGGTIQGTAGPNTLQPGFSHYGLLQGKRGTAPVNQ